MRLLILTQKANKDDNVLGFFHQWIEEFAKQCEQVTVVCLEEGTHSLPNNVQVLSLGKEIGTGKLMRTFRFFKYIIRERHEYDTVFVHMNPEYLVLAGWLWRLWGKKISLWYMHKSITWKLQIAEKFVHRIFSGSQESFRLGTDKLTVTGHGIDTDYFASPSDSQTERQKFGLISIGRLSRSKGHDVLIHATDSLADQGTEVSLVIIGGPVTNDDHDYERELHSLVEKHSMHESVFLAGGMSHRDIKEYLEKSDLFLHASETGSVDKTVLEAMSMGIPVLSSSDAFESMLGEASSLLVVSERTSDAFAKRIKEIMWLSGEERTNIGKRLRSIVERDHSLPALIERLVKDMQA